MKTTIRLIITILPLLCLSAAGPKVQAVLPPPDGGYPNFNTAEGQNALFSLTAGSANTAVGWFSLWGNAEGSFNSATGAGALLFNTADQNTAVGAAALLFNTDGFDNTAIGAAALLNNNLGIDNTAVGANALFSNGATTGDTATGGPGSANTAVGSDALFSNTTGIGNTASGAAALQFNTTGGNNTACGVLALSANTSGSFNTALGRGAGSSVTTANNVIAIGISAENVSNSCYIGQIYSNVQPIVGTDPDSVTINSSGRLGRGNVSSRRYKHDIQPMDKASEALYELKPVSFRYNKEYDATQTLAFGLIAEEVAKVYPTWWDAITKDNQNPSAMSRLTQCCLMSFSKSIEKLRNWKRLLRIWLHSSRE